MKIRAAESIEDVDSIVHLIPRGCCHTNSDYPVAGIIAFMGLAVFDRLCRLWVIELNGQPVGYVLAQVKSIYYTVECEICDLNMDEITTNSFQKQVFSTVQDWAIQNNAQRIFSRTSKADAFCKLFGFTNTGMSYIIYDMR